MQISEIHLYHGWGFDADLWKKWIRQAAFTRYQLFDRGYTGNPLPPQDFRVDSKIRILISHSLGLHFIPGEVISQAGLLVIIGGFDRFHPVGDRLSRKKMARMLDRFCEMPLTVMADFYTNCMLPDKRIIGSPGNLNIELLGKDLKLLNETRLKTLGALKEKPVLLFHGQGDIIVPVGQSRMLHGMLQGSRLIEFSRAGHMLPVTHRELIFRNVLGYLKLINDEK